MTIKDAATLSKVLLAAFPSATRIVDLRSYRPQYLPYPARVTLETGGGMHDYCVIKVGERFEALAREAQVLRALGELGLPVPTVLAGPLHIDDDGNPLPAVILSELPGEPLPWTGVTDLADADLTCQLIQVAVDTLHSLTDRVSNHEIATALPRLTLLGEFDTLHPFAGAWADVPLLIEAMNLLRAILPTIRTPLVFSNGDYNPLNFLHAGRTLTGWVDFEHACFEDPYIGFAKFMLWADDDYGWGTGRKAGLVERFLYAHNVSRTEFLPRLLLRALRSLQDQHITGVEFRAGQPQNFLRLLTEAVAHLKAAMQ